MAYNGTCPICGGVTVVTPTSTGEYEQCNYCNYSECVPHYAVTGEDTPDLCPICGFEYCRCHGD